MTTQPWYHCGLNFECTGCGDCLHGRARLRLDQQDRDRGHGALMKLDVAKFEKKYVRLIGIRKSLIELANGDCVFFDNQGRGCKIYDARPQQCRTWPFWDSILNSPESWDETAAHCPGCNHGPIIPLEEIERQRLLRRV